MALISLTGGSGFVGKNLIPYLRKHDFEVSTISRNQLENISIELLNHTEVLVHLAGKAHDLKKSSDPDAYYQVNFELTKKLFDAFLKSNVKKFVFISSVKACADAVEGVLSEDNRPDPQTDYGRSKLMAEEYIEQQVLPEGKSYFILRPCMIHGPGNKGNLNLLYQLVEKGVPYPLAAFDNQRSFLSVENLCFVIERLINSSEDMPSGVFNVADDEALSTREVVKILGESLNKKAKLWEIPVGLVRMVAKLGTALSLPLTTERLQKMTENYVVSNRKIKDILKIGMPLTAREGLGITASSFKGDVKSNGTS